MVENTFDVYQMKANFIAKAAISRTNMAQEFLNRGGGRGIP